MKNKKSLIINIVTPSFNQGEFIQETIESVLGQKYPAVHYWVVDGGSTDNTVQILKTYEGKLSYVSESDKGQTDAINKGIKKLDLQDGQIFAYINSDDYYQSGAFEKVIEAFEQNPTKQWLVGDALIVNEKGDTIQEFVRYYKQFLRQTFSKSILLITNPIPQPAVFIRAEAMKKIGAFDVTLRYTMDYDYWLRLEQEFGNPIFLDEQIASFRIHGASKGKLSYRDQFDEDYQVAKRYTQSSFLLALHQIHSGLILFLYSLLKW